MSVEKIWVHDTLFVPSGLLVSRFFSFYFQYKPSLEPLPYEELDLEQPSEAFDVQHELTRKGIEKFVADYRATLSRPA